MVLASGVFNAGLNLLYISRMLVTLTLDFGYRQIPERLDQSWPHSLYGTISIIYKGCKVTSGRTGWEVLLFSQCTLLQNDRTLASRPAIFGINCQAFVVPDVFHKTIPPRSAVSSFSVVCAFPRILPPERHRLMDSIKKDDRNESKSVINYLRFRTRVQLFCNKCTLSHVKYLADRCPVRNGFGQIILEFNIFHQ